MIDIKNNFSNLLRAIREYEVLLTHEQTQLSSPRVSAASLYTLEEKKQYIINEINQYHKMISVHHHQTIIDSDNFMGISLPKMKKEIRDCLQRITTLSASINHLLHIHHSKILALFDELRKSNEHSGIYTFSGSAGETHANKYYTLSI